MMQHYGYGISSSDPGMAQPGESQASSSAGADMGGSTAAAPVPSGHRGHADISSILDQIMNITDQSLDEAQVPKVSFTLFCYR